MKPKTSIRSLLLGTATILSILGLWFLLTPRIIPELIFPSPSAVGGAIRTLGFGLIIHSSVTLGRVLAGWSIGVLFGMLMGILMTSNRTVSAIAYPVIEIIRPTPPIALIPFFIIWFGLGLSGQIVLVALGCFMVLAVNTFVAIHNVPPIYVRAASALGAPKGQIYRTIIMPAILPDLASGFRVAAALAFATTIAAEFMGAQSGIGFLIMVARRTLNTDTILLGTIIIAIESLFVDQGITLVSKRLCRWSESPLEALQRLEVKILESP